MITLEILIKKFGDIPLCKCRCGNKVNIKSNKIGSYKYYINRGYPKYINGHNARGKTNPMFGISSHLKGKKGKDHPSYGLVPKSAFKEGHIPWNKDTIGLMSEAWNKRKKCPYSTENIKKVNKMFKENPELHPIRKIFRRGIISHPQKKLYNIILKYFKDAELEYPLGSKFLDIAIPSINLDIEYDGEYWHKNKKDLDLKRDIDVFKLGWKTIRFNKNDKFTEECISKKLKENNIYINYSVLEENKI